MKEFRDALLAEFLSVRKARCVAFHRVNSMRLAVYRGQNFKLDTYVDAMATLDVDLNNAQQLADHMHRVVQRVVAHTQTEEERKLVLFQKGLRHRLRRAAESDYVPKTILGVEWDV